MEKEDQIKTALRILLHYGKEDKALKDALIKYSHDNGCDVEKEEYRVAIG